MSASFINVLLLPFCTVIFMKDASIRVFWAQSEKQLIPSYHVQTGFHYRTF